MLETAFRTTRSAVKYGSFSTNRKRFGCVYRKTYESNVYDNLVRRSLKWNKLAPHRDPAVYRREIFAWACVSGAARVLCVVCSMFVHRCRYPNGFPALVPYYARLSTPSLFHAW